MNKELATECINRLNDMLDEIENCNSGEEYYEADEVKALIKKLKRIK